MNGSTNPINWELIIALCAVVISVLSPVAVAFINSCRESRMYRRKNYSEYRAKIIEEYIASVERAVYEICNPVHGYGGYIYKQTAHFHEIHLYVSPESAKEIDEMEQFLKGKHVDSSQQFRVVIQSLSKEPPRSEK